VLRLRSRVQFEESHEIPHSVKGLILLLLPQLSKARDSPVLCPLFYDLIGLHQVLCHFKEQAGVGWWSGHWEEVALLATLDMVLPGPSLT
jgi:hypothetical protein